MRLLRRHAGAAVPVDQLGRTQFASLTRHGPAGYKSPSIQLGLPLPCSAQSDGGSESFFVALRIGGGGWEDIALAAAVCPRHRPKALISAVRITISPLLFGGTYGRVQTPYETIAASFFPARLCRCVKPAVCHGPLALGH
jgi:hypothetical protein